MCLELEVDEVRVVIGNVQRLFLGTNEKECELRGKKSRFAGWNKEEWRDKGLFIMQRRHVLLTKNIY